MVGEMSFIALYDSSPSRWMDGPEDRSGTRVSRLVASRSSLPALVYAIRRRSSARRRAICSLDSAARAISAKASVRARRASARRRRLTATGCSSAASVSGEGQRIIAGQFERIPAAVAIRRIPQRALRESPPWSSSTPKLHAGAHGMGARPRS